MTTNNSINNSVKVTTYTSNDTWTKDSRTKVVEIYAWAGGSGGGSGRQSSSGNASGGGGGAGGSCLHVIYPSSAFGNSESVVVGTGGAGGLAQAAADTNGNAGDKGLPSSFGNLITDETAAITSPAGAGGTNATANGGSIPDSLIDGVIFTAQLKAAPGGGGDGKTIDGVSASFVGSSSASFTRLANSVLCASGGGGGSGANSVTVRTAGSGGNLVKVDGTVLQAGGAGGVETGTINGANGGNQLTSGGTLSGGCGGGGGGGQSAGASAGKGGDGGFPGGGGGGGGGSLNGTSSGAGGKGGDGKIIVIEYF